MNGIQQIINPSISRAQGYIVSFNCNHNLIPFSRTELRLYYTFQLIAIQLQQQTQEMELSKNQERTNQSNIEIHQSAQKTESPPIQIYETPKFIPLKNEHSEFRLGQHNNHTGVKKEIKKQKMKHLNSQSEHKKREQKSIQLFSFKKSQPSKKPEKLFKMLIPKTKQKMVTSFQQLNLNTKNSTVKDFKEYVLNVQANTVILYQFEESLNLNTQLNDDMMLDDLQITGETVFKFIQIGGQYFSVKNDFGEVYLTQSCDTKLISIQQDMIEISDEIKEFVRNIVFYDFGKSNPYVYKLKSQNKTTFKKIVFNWAKQHNLHIIHLNQNLIVNQI